MNTVIFRPATLEDLPVLNTFEQKIVEAERPFNPTLKATGVTYYDIGALIKRTDAIIMVGTIDNQIVTSGYALLKKGPDAFQYDIYALLGFMYVNPTYRGRGINRLLINELIDWAKEQEVYEIRLDVYSDNAPAIRAYEKVGFKKLIVEMRLDLKEK